MPASTFNYNLFRVLDLSGRSASDPRQITPGPLVQSSDNEPERATYGCAVFNVTPAANPTDLIGIVGSATRTIRVKSIIVSGSATSATNIGVYLQKRTAVNTGGTSTAQTIAPHDTADGAATATVPLYTANPTGLGAGSVVHASRLNLAPAANGSIDRIFWQFTWLNDKGLVLRGSNELLMINLGGAAWPAGGALDVDLEWTEE